MRKLAIGFGVLVGVVVILGVGGVLLLDRVNLAGFVAGRASSALGRTVTIGDLRVTPGVWVTVRASGVAMANAPGGSKPEMASVKEATAQVRAWSLVRGPIELRGVAADGVSVLLEHTADGKPNWRDGPERAAASGTRKGFPSLRDVHVKGLEVVFRTRSGTPLVTKLEEVGLESAADDQPTHLVAHGTYQGAPAVLDAALHSIDEYRDETVPFGTLVRLNSGPVALVFDGTMTQPLNIDGAEGKLTVDAPDLTNVMTIVGSPGPMKVALKLAGELRHSGALWWLASATGAVQGSGIEESWVQFIEGTVPRPDRVTTDLDFATLDADKLKAAASGGSGGGGNDETSLVMSETPGTLIDALIRAKGVRYEGVEVRDFGVEVKLEPGVLAVSKLSMTAFGGPITGDVTVKRAGDKAGTVAAQVSMAGVELQAARRQLGLGSVPVTGALQGLFVASATAPTLEAAMKTGQVRGLLAMRGGTVAKSVMEKASLDIRALVRTAEGVSPITCMLAGLEMRGGVGTVSPLRLRAADGTVTGYARFDLNRKVLDLTIGTVSQTTGAFALDVPIRVSGSFSDPSVAPAEWSAEGRAQLMAPDNLGGLPGPLAAMARRYSCPR